MNTNVMELNLNEMEQISGGKWNWGDAIFGMVLGGTLCAACGAVLGGVTGGLIGGVVGVGIGAGVTALK